MQSSGWTVRLMLVMAAALGSLDAAPAQAQAPAKPAAPQRDAIVATGSSTVAPYTIAVGQRFAEATRAPRPRVDQTGTVRGYNLFCQGMGMRYPDVQNASRRMNNVEFNLCVSKGVREIIEVPIGHDGIVLAFRRDSGTMNVTRTQFWRAVAAEVPQGDKWVPNPYSTWRQVDGSLPDWPIQILGPPPTSGTRDSFTDLVLTPGCQAAPEVRAITDAARRKAVCTTVRTDGRWVDAGEDDEKIVARIVSAAPGTVQGAFGYSFLANHAATLGSAAIEGVMGTPEMIASGQYPVSRMLYIYVKEPNVRTVPGLQAFVDAYAAELGPDGPLAKIGLVPLDPAALRRTREIVKNHAILLRAP